MRRLAVALALLTLGVPLAGPAAALERGDFRLPAPLLHGAAGGGRVWLLVGDDDDGPRQLLELRFESGKPQLHTLAAELPGKTDGLVAAPATEGEPPRVLVLRSGAGVTAADGGANAPQEVFSGPGRLLPGAVHGRFSYAPPWLVAARAGEARALAWRDGTLVADEPVGLPVTAKLERWGLHLTTPEAAFAGSWLAVGPQQEGVHLRTVVLGAGGERRQCTSELPAPERVADSSFVTLDGRPTLVAGTFRGLGLMSRKQLRVFALVDDAGAAPRHPLLSRELEARAWQDLQAVAGDFDGDGRDDLALAYSEGLGEGKATVTLFRGLGGGRLRAEPTSVSFDVKDSTWSYGADVDGDGRPDLVTLGGGRLEAHTSTPNGLPGKKPSLTLKVDGTDLPAHRTVEVNLGGEGVRTNETAAPVDERDPRAAQPGATPRPERLASPEWELIDVDGDGKAELLWWAPDADGRTTHLIVLRF